MKLKKIFIAIISITAIFVSSSFAVFADTIPTSLGSRPAIATSPKLENFIKGPDSAIWYVSKTGFYNWKSLGGSFRSNPEVVYRGVDINGASILTVFAVGNDNALWYRSAGYSGWGSWKSLGGNFVSDPEAVSISKDRMDVFVVDANNNLMHIYYKTSSGSDKGVWSSWEYVGGNITGTPKAIANSKDTINVIVKATDNSVHTRGYDGTSWGNWESLGGVITSDVEACSWGKNNLTLFGRGTDNSLWTMFWNNSYWTNWYSLGGQITSTPSAVCWGPNRIDVFANGMDSQLWHRAYENSTWYGWEYIGSGLTLLSDPVAVSLSANRLNIYAKGENGVLWTKCWISSENRWSDFMMLDGKMY